jgi:hypothetical protein
MKTHHWAILASQGARLDFERFQYMMEGQQDFVDTSLNTGLYATTPTEGKNGIFIIEIPHSIKVTAKSFVGFINSS